jgi:hypothetical protein
MLKFSSNKCLVSLRVRLRYLNEFKWCKMFILNRVGAFNKLLCAIHDNYLFKDIHFIREFNVF